MKLGAWLAAAACLAAIIPQNVSAQNYPSRSVRWIIPFSTGAGNDTVGRYVAEELSKVWGQTVVPENRPGASGNIGANVVARAAPDGHTLLFMSSTYTINAAQPDIPFDPLKDLTIAGVIGITDLVVVVSDKVAATNVKEFVEESKKRKMLWGSAGSTSSAALASYLFIDAAGVDTQEVPYKGSGEILVDMLGGRIDFTIGSTSTVLPLIEDKKIRPIAATGESRLKSLPNVPTLAEQGLKNAGMQVWWGVYVPSGTPQAIIEKLNADINRIISTPAAAEFFAKQDAVAKQMTTAQANTLVVDEIAKWKALMKKLGPK